MDWEKLFEKLYSLVLNLFVVACILGVFNIFLAILVGNKVVIFEALLHLGILISIPTIMVIWIWVKTIRRKRNGN